jgi:hypothetical protein
MINRALHLLRPAFIHDGAHCSSSSETLSFSLRLIALACFAVTSWTKNAGILQLMQSFFHNKFSNSFAAQLAAHP